ncbi:hypothetical protein [Acinetobacter sp. TSRC1-2]|uniref:hypothetical protein n=1 Tax=unclassified Acinetobacter TaxID=196816 RepID=UPI003CEEAE36
MKLTQLLLASTFTIAAATTFAASADKQPQEEKVIVSTQEQPETVSPESAVTKPTSAQPAPEVAAEEAPAKPVQ